MKSLLLRGLFMFLLSVCANLSFGQFVQDTNLFLSPKDLVYDEKCYVFSTLDLKGIKRYEGIVKGVLWNGIGPKQDLIVIEVFGDSLFKEGGIYHGMSGSPVLVERKRQVVQNRHNVLWRLVC